MIRPNSATDDAASGKSTVNLIPAGSDGRRDNVRIWFVTAKEAETSFLIIGFFVLKSLWHGNSLSNLNLIVLANYICSTKSGTPQYSG